MAGGRRRLFFALWPDETVRAQLAALQERLPQAQGRWVHPEDLHLTLQFLGSVEPGRQACIAEAARAVQGEPFELEIDRIDFWSKPRIAWAGPEAVPRPLKRLVRMLAKKLEPCGFEPERRPYKPHVTLVRKSTPVAAMKLPEPILWAVEHFVLVESRPNGDPPHYRPVEGWPLGD